MFYLSVLLVFVILLRKNINNTKTTIIIQKSSLLAIVDTFNFSFILIWSITAVWKWKKTNMKSLLPPLCIKGFIRYTNNCCTINTYHTLHHSLLRTVYFWECTQHLCSGTFHLYKLRFLLILKIFKYKWVVQMISLFFLELRCMLTHKYLIHVIQNDKKSKLSNQK